MSPTEAFVVGECTSQATGYIEQWNGSAWSMATLPDPNTTNPVMTKSLSAISADSATLIEHYNGTSWSVVSSPAGGTSPYLTGVAAESATDVWAVGYAVPATGAPTLTMNWTGTAWSTGSSPDVGSSSLLVGVSSTPGGPIWAAGYSVTSGAFNPLIVEHS